MNSHSPFPRFQTPGAQPVPKAGISSNLWELLQPGIEDSAKGGHEILIQVVGNDLPNLEQPKYTDWRKLLKRWLELRVKVEYLVVDRTEQRRESAKSTGEEILRDAKGESDQEIGSIALFFPNVEKVENADQEFLLELLEEHRESHFLLALDRTDERLSQMWIENEHPPGSTDAFDCFYFNSKAVSLSPQFTLNKRNFAFMKAHSEEIRITLLD